MPGAAAVQQRALQTARPNCVYPDGRLKKFETPQPTTPVAIATARDDAKALRRVEAESPNVCACPSNTASSALSHSQQCS